MSDDIQVETKLTSDTLTSFGAKLRYTREQMGLSAMDAASRLHLSPRTIDILENDDLQKIQLPPIYLRGYLRSYSKLLQIPANEIAAVLEKLEPTPAILTAIPAHENSSEQHSFINNPHYTRVASFFVGLILLTSVGTWWYVHSGSSNPTILAANQPLSSSMTDLSSDNLRLAANTVSAPSLTNNPVVSDAVPAAAPANANASANTSSTASQSINNETLSTNTSAATPAAKKADNNDDNPEEID